MSSDGVNEQDIALDTSMKSLSATSKLKSNNSINSRSSRSIIQLDDPNPVISSTIHENDYNIKPRAHTHHDDNISYEPLKSNPQDSSLDNLSINNSSQIPNSNNSSVNFDISRSMHVPLLNKGHKSAKSITTVTVLRKSEDNKNKHNRQKSTAFALNSHDARTSYQHDLSDKMNKKRFERLNFELTTTEVKHRETWNKRHDWLGKQIQARGLWKWCMCFTIGAFTGTCMFLCSIAIEYLTRRNLNWARSGLQDSFGDGFARFLGVNCLFALISGSMVSFIAPQAAGSGIPDVKGWLNGSIIPKLFSMKTFLVKLIGVIFSVSAKFIIGKEGPMVHAGSALACGMALGRNKILGFDTKTGYSFRNDVDARDFISTGASAGVAAAFGAPIGGMLFALEEVSSFWQPGLTWRAFFAAATSNLFLTLLLGCYHHTCGTSSKASLINFQNDQSNITNGSYNLVEFGFFIFMGAIGGMIGVAFNGVNVRVCLWRKKYLTKPIMRLWEVLLMAVLTTSLLIGTPLLVSCKPIPQKHSTLTIDNLGYSMNYNTTCFKAVTGKAGQYTCDDGYYNPLSSLLMQSSEDVIKDLFMFDSTCWDNVSLWLGSIVYFILAVLTYGLSIPSGLFIPLILIGSNTGHVMGKYWNSIFNDNFDVGTYSLIGASAVLGGSTRMTISLTAIVMEITNDIYFLMPIMMTIMVSKWVGDRFNSALYDAHVALKDIPYLEPKISAFVPSYICAEDIMRPNVITLPSVVDLYSLLNILNNDNNHHQGFPVIDMRNKSVKWLADHGWNQKDGNYLGLILRWHVYIMLKNRCFSEINDPTFRKYKPQILNRQMLTSREWKHKRKIFASEFELNESELSLRYIDFTPYMALSPTAVHRNTPVLSLYNLFKGIGLRHLVVVGNKRQIVGIITTHELCEDALEPAVERVHYYFEEKSEDQQKHLFEERIAFLKGITKRLSTSGNAWKNFQDVAPDAHGKSKAHGKHGSKHHKHKALTPSKNNKNKSGSGLLHRSLGGVNATKQSNKQQQQQPGEYEQDEEENKIDDQFKHLHNDINPNGSD